MIHKTAIVDSTAKVSSSAKVGAYSVIGVSDGAFSIISTDCPFCL